MFTWLVGFYKPGFENVSPASPFCCRRSDYFYCYIKAKLVFLNSLIKLAI